MNCGFVEIRYIGKKNMGVKIRCQDEDIYLKIINSVKNVMSAKYSKILKENIVSVYYYKDLLKALVQYPLEIRISPKIDKINKHYDAKLNQKPLKKIKNYQYPTLWNKNEKLKKEQKVAVEICVRRRRYIIGDEMGIGKTIEAIGIITSAFDMLYEKVLVICLASLREQWIGEILKFTTLDKDDVIELGAETLPCVTGEMERCLLNKSTCRQCEHLKICASFKKSSTRKRCMTQLKGGAKVVVAGYETVRNNYDLIKKQGFDVFILDEASKLKNLKSHIYSRIRSVIENGEMSDIVIPMSGTLIENQVSEFYPVFSIVDPNLFGNAENFKNNFVEFDYFGRATGMKNVKRLKKIVDKFVIRRTLSEVWKDRPNFYRIIRVCPMHELQEKLYNEVATEQVENLNQEIGDKQCVSIINYLQQAADSTEILSDLKKGQHFEHSAKLEALIDMLENELTGKVVIFTFFANLVAPIISKVLKKHNIKHYTTIGAKSKSGIIKKFGKSKDVNVLLCSDSVSYGQNMQMAKYIIQFDLPWNPAKADQRTARGYRRGQKQDFTCIYLVTKGTIDEYVLEVNYDKRNMFEEFFESGIKADNKKHELTVNSLMEALNV